MANNILASLARLALSLIAASGTAAWAADPPPPCFSITVDYEVRNPQFDSFEKHHIEFLHRPAQVGDGGGIYALNDPRHCALSAMRPGQQRSFVFHDARGSATGRDAGNSGSAGLDHIPSGWAGQRSATVIRRERGATIQFYFYGVPSDNHDVFNNCHDNRWQPRIFELTEEDLQSFSNVTKTIQLTYPVGEEGCSGKGTAVLSAPLQPVAEEMLFDPGENYDNWIPTPLEERMPGISVSPPATPLRVRVRIQPKQGSTGARKDTIYFSLEDVARHKGRCGNYPRNALEKDDLRFAAEQPEGIVIDGPRDAHTRDEVTEATIAIEATDTAAYGKLTARASALRLRAIYKPTNQYALVVPRDDDGNRIADAWERLNGAQRNEMADRETVAGQDRAGDGLTVFDEYRGLVVLENGGRTFKRLNPQVKEIFVLDAGGSFDPAVWRKASDILAYKVDDTMLAGGGHPEESRVINFNAEDRDHKKYAIRVETMPGDEDPDDPQKQNPSVGQTACGQCQSPKDADYCRVWPYRIRVRFEDLFRWLTLALTKQGSPEWLELDASGYPRWLAQRALDKLKDPAARQAMVKQMITQVAIHEVGHSLSLRDHDKGVPDEAPSSAAAPIRECPMYYPNGATYRRWVILQSLFRPEADMPMRYVQFCRGLAAMQEAGFNCYTRANVSDW